MTLSSKRYGLPIALILTGAVLYGTTLNFGYSEIDDPKHIFENPALLEPTSESLIRFWQSPFFGLYIPTTYTGWWVQSQTSLFFFQELRPALFRTVNVSLHLANAVLIYFLLLGLLKNRIQAFFGGLIFLIHPVQVQSVSWISAFKDVGSTHLGLWALWLLQRNHLKGFIALSPLAALAKPSMVVLPLIAHILLPKQLNRRACLVLLFLCSVPIGVLTKMLQPDQAVEQWVPFWQRPLIAFDAIGFYLQKLIFPFPLVFDYSRKPEYVLSHFPTLCLLTVITLIGILIVKRSWRSLGQGGATFLVSILPVLGLLPFKFQKFSTVADHYLYFAMFGVALFLAPLIEPGKRIKVALLIVLGLFVMTRTQVQHWKSSVTLLQHNLEHVPNSYLAHNNLGTALYAERRHREAANHFFKAWELKPDESLLLMNAGTSLFIAGDQSRGLQFLRESLNRTPESKTIRYNLVKALRSVGRKGEAQALLDGSEKDQN